MRKPIMAVCAALVVSGTVLPASADQDVTAAYVAKDFSALLKPKSEFLGYIGNDFQRLFMRFASVAQDRNNPALYHVKGSSKVKETECGFEGTLTVQNIVKLDVMHWGVDDEYKDKGLKAEGFFSAHYQLREDCKQLHSGIFSGRMKLDWYIDRNDRLLYDAIENYSDGYSNNQYTGIWTAYGTGKSKTANWGEYRIPNSRELDNGAANFAPDQKYCSHGWDTFENCIPHK